MPEPDSTPDVSILVVAYNSQAIIGDCLASVAPACTRSTYEILLIDNGDGATADLVAAQFPHVRIVPSRGNVGFAAGNNALAAHASGRFLLLLNPDVVLKPLAIDRLMEATQAYPDAAAWGGVTLNADDRPDYGNSVHIPSLREMASRTFGRSLANRDPEAVIVKDEQVEALSGSFVMFSRMAWDEVGGLDERYFLYCEEIDLFYRLGQRGYRFWRVSGAVAHHDIGHGTALNARRMLYRAAGNMQFVQLHWSKPRQWLAFLLMWVGAWQRYAAGRLFGRLIPRIRIVGESHRDIALRPDLWRHGYHEDRGLLARLARAKT